MSNLHTSPHAHCNSLATAASPFTFHGNTNEDIIHFLTELESYARLHSLNPDQQRELLRLSLKGNAATWLANQNRNIDLETLVKIFKLRFMPRNIKTNAIARLSDMKYVEGTSLMTFLDKLQRIALQGQLEDAILVTMALKALPNTLQRRIFTRAEDRNVTWTLIYEFAWANDEGQDIEETQTSFPINYNVKHTKENRQDMNRYKKPTQRNYKTKYCSYHRIKGSHWTSECRARQANPNKTFRKENYSNACTTINTDQLPIINIEIDGGTKIINALIDTDSSVNLIHRKFIKDNDIVRKVNTSFTTANSKTFKPIGICRSYNFTYNGQAIQDDFYVTNQLPFECIIGYKLLSEHPNLLTLPAKTNATQLTCTIYPDQMSSYYAPIFDEFANLFCETLVTSHKPIGTHCIDTMQHAPIAQPAYRLGRNIEEQITKEVDKLLQQGVIRRSTSAWSSPVVPIYKKTGELRLCIDYRKLNAITKRDVYPLPRIDEIFDELGTAMVFSKLDAISGYHQVEIRKSDQEKTAFITRSGIFEYVRMPFGLTNAPATFQRNMDRTLRTSITRNFLLVYLDDIIIYSPNHQTHYEHLKITFQTLKELGIQLNKKKCTIGVDQIAILGHKVKEGKVYTDKTKIEAIRNTKIPKTRQEMQSFLGLVNYCRKFLPKLATISHPLYKTITGDQKTIQHTAEVEKAIQDVKNAIINHTLLQLPDFNKVFILTTDASSIAIGSTLAQLNSAKIEVPVCFYSRILKETEAKYSAFDLELLAIIDSVNNFKHYLSHKKFILKTDNRALTYMKTCRNNSGRLLRWSLKLQFYDFDVQHVKGTTNQADSLSRLTCTNITNQDETIKNMVRNYHMQLGHCSTKNLDWNLSLKYNRNIYSPYLDEIVKTCSTCQKDSKVMFKNHRIAIKTHEFMEILELDLIGPLPPSITTIDIVIALDHHTKYAWVQPIPLKSAQRIVNIIQERMVKPFKKPRQILTEIGLEFKNAHTKAFADEANIELKFGSPYHPETTGAIERFNRTFITKLRRNTLFNEKDWESCLKETIQSYLYSYNRAINTSPYILVKNEIPMFNSELLSLLQPKDLTIINDSDKLQSHKEKYRRSYGHQNITNKFKENELVLYFNKAKTTNKLETKWSEPVKVVKTFFKSYILEDSQGNRFRSNEDNLKRYEQQ